MYSPMELLQWMGAVRLKVQTVDRNIIIVHDQPTGPIKISIETLWVCKKQIQNKYIFGFWCDADNRLEEALLKIVYIVLATSKF